MLTREEIQVLLVKRLIACCDSCNSYHINHVEGQIRGLLAVLMDGEKINLNGDAGQILDAAGIPWKGDGKGWEVDRKWLKKQGCTLKGDDVSHTKLKDW